jgi:hypothetical protein
MTGTTRRDLVLTAGIVLGLAGAVMVAVPPLLASAEADPAGDASPGWSAAPVVSATPIPEPPPRDPWAGDFSVEHEMEIGEREGPWGTAIDTVRTTFPDDYAYGYITDEGFGISFMAQAPAGALAILDAVGHPYDLHENVGFTELNIQPQLNEVNRLVKAAVGRQSFTAGPNVFTVTVEVELYPDSSDEAEPTVLDADAIERLEDAIRPELYPGFDIEITSVPNATIGW